MRIKSENKSMKERKREIKEYRRMEIKSEGRNKDLGRRIEKEQEGK